MWGSPVKVSCILASYNRPTFLRQALKSIQDQTHKDYQLVLVDDSTKMNVFDIVKDFEFTESITIHQDVRAEDRAKVNRLGVNVNKGLASAKGDLICYLGDDDYLFPTWFEKASAYFEKAHPCVSVAFGILKYSESREMDLSEHGEIRWWDEIIKDPMGRLDHNQVIHRRFDPFERWSENIGTEMSVDGWYFDRLARLYDFHPINAFAAVKRLHAKNLQNSIPLYQSGQMDDLRE
jgi:spore maturation protein CgeD